VLQGIKVWVFAGHHDDMFMPEMKPEVGPPDAENTIENCHSSAKPCIASNNVPENRRSTTAKMSQIDWTSPTKDEKIYK
jgi:hypothetical protein